MRTNKQTNKQKIYFLLITLLIIYSITYYLDPTLLWDENVYLGNARSHLTTSNFTEDFRFPLLEYIIAFFWIFTGESVFIAKLILMFFNLTSVFLFYLILKKYFKENLILFTFIFGISPVLLGWATRIYPDSLAMFFMILSFYLLLLETKKTIFFAGIASSLAFLSKFPMALFPIILFLYFLYKKNIKKVTFFSLGSFLALLPWLIFNYVNYGNIIWDILVQYNTISSYTFLEPFSKQLINFLKTFGILTLFIPFGIYYLIKKKTIKYNYFIIIYTLISIIYYFFFVNLKHMRYYLSILPFVLIIAYFGIIFIIDKIEKKKKIKKILLYSILLLMILLTIPIIEEQKKIGYCNKNGPIKETINYLKPKISPEDTLLSNFMPWLAYSLNVKVYNIYASPERLINRFRPKYVVHTDIRAIEYNKTNLDSTSLLKLEKTIIGRCGQIISIYKVILS